MVSGDPIKQEHKNYGSTSSFESQQRILHLASLVFLGLNTEGLTQRVSASLISCFEGLSGT